MAKCVISIILGVCSLVYFIAYAVLVGLNNSFTFVWLFLGIAGLGFPFLHRLIAEKENPWFRRMEGIGLGILLLGLLIFLFVLGVIVRDAVKKPDKNADYVVVLGAHVYGERMSANLRYRVEAAYEYMKQNPYTKVILSGGQGNGEDISEAEAMRRFLAEKGVAEERILIEDASTNTEENIRNSMKLMGDGKKRVVLVSNEFHVFRARKTAERLGCTEVEGLGSRTHALTVPNSYTREVVAVLKYMLDGKISLMENKNGKEK